MKKNIIKIGQFEFIILVIVQEENPRNIDIINNLNKRYKKEYSRPYISQIMKKLTQAKLVTRKDNRYKLNTNGEYYFDLYNKLWE